MFDACGLPSFASVSLLRPSPTLSRSFMIPLVLLAALFTFNSAQAQDAEFGGDEEVVSNRRLIRYPMLPPRRLMAVVPKLIRICSVG